MFVCYAKNFKRLYRFQKIGNTIIRNQVRQEKSTKCATYLFLIRKDFSFKDTKKFTVSWKIRLTCFFKSKTTRLIVTNYLSP